MKLKNKEVLYLIIELLARKIIPVSVFLNAENLTQIDLFSDEAIEKYNLFQYLFLQKSLKTIINY